jgi:DNA sulfur modification protein DndC
MKSQSDARPSSAFREKGLKSTVDSLIEEIQQLYLSDTVPWVVGYSGGKDSTATLQLVWFAVSRLEPSKQSKPVHVISTDTQVENPVVAAWVNRSLETMHESAKEKGLPFIPHRLTPEVQNSFWVNLIGKGTLLRGPNFGGARYDSRSNPRIRSSQVLFNSPGKRFWS